MSLDRIVIRRISCHAHIGVPEEERRSPQLLHVDLILELDLSEAGRTDALEKTVDYVRVVGLVEEVAADSGYKLIEAFGQRICDEILERFVSIRSVHLSLSKYPAVLTDRVDSVGVELFRKRPSPTG